MVENLDLQGIAPEARSMVESLVRERLLPFGLDHVSVEPATDHDGDPVLRIEAIFGAGGVPVEGMVAVRLVDDLRIELAGLGETRFPHLWYRYPLEDSRTRRA